MNRYVIYDWHTFTYIHSLYWYCLLFEHTTQTLNDILKREKGQLQKYCVFYVIYKPMCINNECMMLYTKYMCGQGLSVYFVQRCLKPNTDTQDESRESG